MHVEVSVNSSLCVCVDTNSRSSSSIHIVYLTACLLLITLYCISTPVIIITSFFIRPTAGFKASPCRRLPRFARSLDSLHSTLKPHLYFSFSNENKKSVKVYQHLDCLMHWIMVNIYSFLFLFY